MKDLESFLENPFPKIKVGLGPKQKFGEDHLVRLTVQNTTGIYTQSIIDTTAAQEALFGGINNVQLTRALQKTATENVDRIIEAFAKRNSRLNNYLIATEVDKTSLYSSFFPQGVMPFTEGVNKSNVGTLMNQLHTVIAANPDVAGGAAVVAEYAAFITNYNTTRTLQLTKIGEVDQGITNREAALEAWEDQLFTNLLLIATNNKKNPKIINDFFDQSIVDPDHKTVHSYKLAGAEVLWVKNNDVKAGGKLIVTKKAGPNLRIFGSKIKETFQGDMQEDNVTTELEILFDNFHVPDAEWFAFQNLSDTDELEFKVVYE